MIENSAGRAVNEVFFLDGGLQDIDSLINGLPDGAAWFVLDPSGDGLVQMADILSGYCDLAAIHLLTHGSAGSLTLGATTLDQASLEQYAPQLATVGQALADNGDLLLYGCNVAQGETGQTFIEQLATLTGADVAASTDLTGAASKGGDWELETTTGAVEATALDLQPAEYVHTLNMVTTTLNFSADNQSLWGEGDGTAWHLTLDDLLWRADPEAFVGSIPLIENNLLLPDVDLDYAFDLDNIEFGLLAEFGFSLGVFDLAYPLTVNLLLPNQVKPGDEFTVGTFVGNVTNPSLTVDGPSLEASLALKASGEVNGYVDLIKNDEEMCGIQFDHEQLGGELSLFDINGLDIATGDKFASFTAEHGWTDDILGGSKVFRTPYGSVGYNVDFNMFDGASDSVGTIFGNLPDLNVRLTQDDPLFWGTFDVDDILGGVLEWLPEPALKSAGEVLRRLDMVYRNSFLQTDIELGLLSVDFTVGFKPYIDITYDIQDVLVTLTCDDNPVCTESLGETFTFEMPEDQTTSLTLNASYELISNVDFEIGFIMEGGANVRLLTLEGEVLGLSLLGGGVDGSLLEFNLPSDPDGSLKDLWTPEFDVASWVDSTTLGGYNYLVPVGATTIEAEMPDAPPRLRVSVAGGAEVAEGSDGARSMTINITREGNIDQATSASYTFVWGSGLTAADFVGGLPANGSLSFAAGETSKSVSFQVAGDTTYESNESFTFILQSSQASVLTPTTSITLLNDDRHVYLASGFLLASPGDDIIHGSTSSDTIYAGGGHDTIDTIGKGSDFVDGGTGVDTLTVDLSDVTSSLYTSFYAEDGSTIAFLTQSASFVQVHDALLNAVSFRITNGTDIRYQNVERVNVTAGSGHDLVINQGGSFYHGGAGSDTFYADWSGWTEAVVWENDPSQAVTINGVTISGMERLLIATGSGDDVITNVAATNDYFELGAGNDSFVGGSGTDTVYAGAGDDVIDVGRGTAWIDGGTGVDTLTVDLSDVTSSLYTSFYAEDGSTIAFLTQSASFVQVHDALLNAVSFRITNGTDIRYQNVERVNVTAGSGHDLVINQGGSFYHGGAGSDTFYADWSGWTEAVVWENDPSQAVTINGVTISGMERLLIATGSGDDVITNVAATNDYFELGAGNDSFVGGSGTDTVYAGAGDDVIDVGRGTAWIDGGTGVDTLTVDLSDVTSSLYTSFYAEDGSTIAFLTQSASFVQVHDALLNAVSFRITNGTDIRYQNVERVNVTAGSGHDLVINQGGSFYHGGAGSDTFYADWSGWTEAVVWENNPSQAVTINGVTISGMERLLIATGSGDDVITNVAATNDYFELGAGNDSFVGGSGTDTVYAGAGDDVIDVGRGTAWIDGGSGWDRLTIDLSDMTSSLYTSSFAEDGSATLLTHTASFVQVRDALLNAVSFRITNGTDIRYQNVERVNVTAGSGSDLVIYQGGSFYHGGAGTDTFYADWSGWTEAVVWENDPAQTVTINGVTVSGMERLLIATGSGDDVITNVTATNDTFHLGGGNDILSAGGGSDEIQGDTGADTLTGGAGNDVFRYQNKADSSALACDTITDFTAGDNLTFTAMTGIRLLNGAVAWEGSVAATIAAIQADTDYLANSLAFFTDGTDGWLYANGAGTGVDFDASLVRLQGRTTALGVNDIVGESGTVTRPILAVSPATVSLAEGDSGTMTAFTYTVTRSGDLSGASRVNWSVAGSGIAPADAIDFDGNVLPGGVLNFAPGAGSATITINVAGDVLTEADDSFVLTLDKAMGATFAGATAAGVILTDDNTVVLGSDEPETVGGTDEADALLGLGGDDTLEGGAGDDLLDGGTGADTLHGGAGNDTYVLDEGGDQAVEADSPDSGIDTLHSSVSCTLPAGVEHLVLTGAAAIDATGNELANSLTGNDVANTLDGGAGDDQLFGLGGDDTLIGGTGADTMHGGAGNDSYFVDNAADVTTEADAADGQDTVYASVSRTLGDHLEELVLLGAAAINGSGNALDNVLVGNTGNNALVGGAGNDSLDGAGGNDSLDGGVGADTMTGGVGNDTYYVDNAADLTTETSTLATEIDTVVSTISSTLGANIERLILSGSAAINGTGNALNNSLTGNAGNNTLNGGAGTDSLDGAGGSDSLDGGVGADTMTGGAGNDTYYVDNASDVTTETSALVTEIDTVVATISLTLGANIERLILSGTAAINGTGNALNNALIGNAAANVLNGSTGADTMLGGTGNDTYYVDNAADVTTETSTLATEIDTVVSTVSRTLGANIERLTFAGTAAINGTGNALKNVLTGNAAANILNGGTGADTMTGGAGNDTYYVDNTADVTTETSTLATEIDTVVSTVSRTLGANIERLTLAGTAAINGTGNALNNSLTGNAAANILNGGAGNDILDGAAGADTMLGMAGNDTYYVNIATDRVFETTTTTGTVNAGGVDRVISTASYTLGNFVENLTLAGTAVINGTGNALNNSLTGNAAANTLNGAAGNDVLSGGVGNDVLIGGLGNDTLVGGAGKDIFLFDTTLNATTNRDSLTDFSVVDDTIRLDRTIFAKLTTLGTLNSAWFKASATGRATDSNDYLLYNTTTGALLYDKDATGAGAAVQFATLTTKPKLTAADFVVVA